MSQPLNPLPYVTPGVGRDQQRLKRRRVLRRLGMVMAVCAVLACAGLFVLYRLALSVGLMEQPFHEKLAAQAVAQIMAGALKPSPNGVVLLPPALASASLDGKAYVTIDSAGVTYVLFRTWQGKGANLRGYAYHNNPAPAPPPPAAVKLWGPVIGTPQMIDYDVESQEGPNWYRVKFDLD